MDQGIFELLRDKLWDWHYGAALDAVNLRNQTPRQLCLDPSQGTRDDAVKALFP